MTRQFEAVINKNGSIRTIRVQAQNQNEAKRIAETMLGLTGEKDDRNGRVTAVRDKGRA